MIDAVNKDDVQELSRLFTTADDKQILYWHMIKCFKYAFSKDKVEVLEFIIDKVDMPLNHEAFDGFLFGFIYSCKKAEDENDDLQKDINRLLCSFLMRGFGKGQVDPI